MISLPEWLKQALLVLYLLATFVQCISWWGVFGRLAFRNLRAKSPNPAISRAPVSVVICARNEALNLKRNLQAILTQKFENQWELCVVDDASTDETPAVLQTFQEKHPERLRVIRLAEKLTPGKKHALAQGIAAARYDFILLTDADGLPASPNWISLMIGTLSAQPETEIVLGYGPNFNRPGHSWNAFFRYETAFTAAQYFSFALAGMPYMGVGRNLAFKRKVFDRVGGFSSHAHIASGDDDLLVNAAANTHNTAICVDPESFVYSEAPSNFKAWLRQKQRHLAAGPAYRSSHKMMLAMLALSLVGHYLLFSILLLAGGELNMVLGVFLLRQFTIGIVFGRILRILRETGLFFRIPLLDFGLAIYNGVVVPWFLIRKKRVEWKG